MGVWCRDGRASWPRAALSGVGSQLALSHDTQTSPSPACLSMHLRCPLISFPMSSRKSGAGVQAKQPQDQPRFPQSTKRRQIRSHRGNRQGGTSDVTTLSKNELGNTLSLLSGVAFGVAPMCPTHTLGVGWGGSCWSQGTGRGGWGGCSCSHAGKAPRHLPTLCVTTSPGSEN